MGFIKWIFLFSIMLGGAGCNAASQWSQDQKRKSNLAGKDTCGRRYLEPYIGTDYDAIDARDLLPSRYTMRVIDERDVLPPGSDYWVLTTDLRITRIDIAIDEAGLIDSLVCS